MPINLTPHQQVAFDGLNQFLASHHKTAVLDGPAGSGKTHLTAEFIKHHLSNRSICVLAPSNKALSVIREALTACGVDMYFVASATVHSLLRLRVINNEDGSTSTARTATKGPTYITGYDLLIVDESSLVSHDLYTRLLSCCLEPKLLFVGDSFQIPPVKCSRNISPVFTDIKLKFELTEIVRQAAGNPIIDLTVAIRHNPPSIKMSMDNILKAIPEGASSKLLCKTGSLTDIVNATKTLQLKGRDARALAYTNAQVCAINQRVHDGIFPKDMFGIGERVLNYSGDAACLKYLGSSLSTIHSMDEFIVCECQPAGIDVELGLTLAWLKLKELKTGAEYEVIVPADNEAYRLLIKRAWSIYNRLNNQYCAITRHNQEKERLDIVKKAVSADNLQLQVKYPDLRFSYAMTAHTSQGSTFDDVILDYNNLLGMRVVREFNAALYVGCSRPRDRLVIFY